MTMTAVSLNFTASSDSAWISAIALSSGVASSAFSAAMRDSVSPVARARAWADVSECAGAHSTSAPSQQNEPARHVLSPNRLTS